MRVITVRLPRWMIMALRDMKEKYGSVSEAIRRAILLLFERDGVDTEQYRVAYPNKLIITKNSARRQPWNNMPPLSALIELLMRHNAMLRRVGGSTYKLLMRDKEYVIRKDGGRWHIYLEDSWLGSSQRLSRAIIKAIYHSVGALCLPNNVLE